jgi:uncharacterized membrane protein YgdD (TMEM256/DUF423 family)
MILFIGAILGFLSVVFGAYADHGLRAQVTPEVLNSVMTAIRYHQIHALVIVAIGLALVQGGKFAEIPALRWAAHVFVLGILLFSGGIYAAALLHMPQLTILTPFGGITFMVGWLVLAWAGFRVAGRLGT